jgi:hypothetical protein
MALVSKPFGDIITFTRASSATYFDATGTLQTATTDQPRFDYNPSTLAANGLLIEEARTNLQTYSEDVLSWTFRAVNATFSSTAATAPDGATTANSIVEGATTNNYRAYNAVTTVAATTYTASCFFKALPGSAQRYLRLTLWDPALTNGYAFINCDPNTGTVTSSLLSGPAVTDGWSNLVVNAVQDCGNGWYRFSMTVTTGTGTALRLQAALVDVSTTTVTGATGGALNYAGDGTSGAYFWGAQLEEGAFPTSYIPTVASTVTRAIDVAQVNTLSPWFNASEGTLYAQAEVAETALTQRTMALIGRSTSAAQDIVLYISRPADSRRLAIVSNATTQFQYGPTGAVTSSKGALAYKTDDSQAAFEGTSSPVDTSVTLPVAVTTMYLGNDDSGILVLNGWLKRVTYYPRRLSQAELETITS